MTLIADDNIFALSTILFGLAALGFWTDSTRIGKKTSGALWTIVVGLLLSNFHVIPFASPVYEFIGGYLVPVSIPLLLFKADLRKIIRESGPVMITFLIACAATAFGAVVGYYVFDLGPLGAKVAGVYTGGWTGGTVNFVAVAKAFELTPEEFSVAISANSVVSIMALMTLITIPSIGFLRRHLPSAIMDNEDSSAGEVQAEPTVPEFRLLHIAGALALSFFICTVSNYLAAWLSLEQFSILIITVLAVVVANVFPKPMNKLEGDFDLGMLILFVFFASIGAGTNATSFLGSALNLFFFSVFILVVHLVVMLVMTKLLKIDLAETVIASAAALVGPVPAAAISIARGWRELVTPGIMCGIFGYVIGTFIGVGVVKLLL